MSFNNVGLSKNPIFLLHDQMNLVKSSFGVAKVKRSSRSIEKMKENVERLKEISEQQESLFSRFIRKLLNLFGIITAYQRIVMEIERLEKNADLLSFAVAVKISAQEVAEQESAGKIREKIKVISKDFCEIESEITRLKKSAGYIKKVNEEFCCLQRCLNVYQQEFVKLIDPMGQLLQVYKNDKKAFRGIKPLVKRYEAAEEELQKTRAILLSVIDPKLDGKSKSNEGVKPSKLDPESTKRQGVTTSKSKVCAVAGVENPGNTCYIASALQSINAVTVYRDLFDPDKNPLKIRDNESELSLKQRIEIQALGNQILKQIQQSELISGDEINKFRKSCCEHEVSPTQKLIDSETGQVDAEEVLIRFLTMLDYQEPQLFFKDNYFIQDKDNFIPCSLDETKSPQPFSSIDEFQEPKKSKEGSLSLSVASHLNTTVSMKTLIKEFYEKELIEVVLVHQDKGTGELCLRNYKEVEKTKELDLAKSPFPEVLRVIIQQQKNKATVTKADVIYPSGEKGVGPKYNLVSVIEHKPGHYIAHLKVDGGFIEANDAVVRVDPSSDFAGCCYLYVLDKSEI